MNDITDGFNAREYVDFYDLPEDTYDPFDDVDESSKALKYDDGKPDYSLLPEVFLTQVARSMMAGVLKYERFNYLKGLSITRYTSAIVRHTKKIEAGEWLDKDTSERLGQNVTHLACIAANCLMALHQTQEGTLEDDTYSKQLELDKELV